MEDKDIEILKDYLKKGYYLWLENENYTFDRIIHIGLAPVFIDHIEHSEPMGYFGPTNGYVELRDVAWDDVIVTFRKLDIKMDSADKIGLAVLCEYLKIDIKDAWIKQFTVRDSIDEYQVLGAKINHEGELLLKLPLPFDGCSWFRASKFKYISRSHVSMVYEIKENSQHQIEV